MNIFEHNEYVLWLNLVSFREYSISMFVIHCRKANQYGFWRWFHYFTFIILITLIYGTCQYPNLHLYMEILSTDKAGLIIQGT